MNIRNDLVLAAVIYSLTKKADAPLFVAADPAEVEKARGLGIFFIQSIGGGPLKNHDQAKVAASLAKHPALAGVTEDVAALVTQALFDVVGTVIDNVY